MAETSQAQGNGRFDAKDAGMLLALLLVAVIALWPILCAAPAQAPGLPGQDGRTQWYPWRALAADSIRHGSLPLWNPYVLCGVPFLGNFQSALFYPPNFIFAVAPIGVAARASILFHVWLSMIFAYLLARMVGCRSRRRGGGRDGVRALRRAAPESSRRALGRLVRDPVAGADLSLHRMDDAPAEPLGAARRRVRRGDAGPQRHAAVRLHHGDLGRLLRADPAARRGRPIRPCARAARSAWAMVAGMWLLGAALAAVQLLPGIEAAANGARSLPMLKNWLMVFSLGPECLLTMVVPGLFGGTVDGSFYWGRWLSWEMNAYIGIAALVLAVYALICERPRRAVACFALTACLALLLALGEHTRATDLLALTPLGGMFRGPAKFLLPFSLALSVLAAIGDGPAALRRAAETAAVHPRRRRRGRDRAGRSADRARSGRLMAASRPELRRMPLPILDPNAEAASASALPAVHDGLQALLLLGALVGGYMLFRRKPTAAAFVIFFIVATDAVLFSRGFIGPATTFRAEKSAWPEGAGAALRREGGDRRTWAMDIPEMDDAMLERVPVVEGIEPNPPARFHRTLPDRRRAAR